LILLLFFFYLIVLNLILFIFFDCVFFFIGICVQRDLYLSIRRQRQMYIRIRSTTDWRWSPVHVISGDQGFLPAPVSVKQLSLAPGERREILVDMSNGDEVWFLIQLSAPRGGTPSRYAVFCWKKKKIHAVKQSLNNTTLLHNKQYLSLIKR
ncbi:hypothetical protein J4536_23455, partial [Escherichia coli]|nr:hypothetical protein [Escherichia coli]